MPRRVATIALSLAALVVAGCGSEGIELSEDDPNREGAELFAERCGGCHTLKAAGSEGTANRSQREQGPNLDQRKETYAEVLYAIQHGGFSGGIMPQNIAVGEDAEKIARFVEEYAGSDVKEDRRP